MPFGVLFRVDDQPARTFRQREAHHGIDQRGQRLDAEHPPPRGFHAAQIADDVVGEVSHQDAEHNVELEKPGQLAPVARRRDFGDEKRSRDGRNPHPDAPDETKDDEGPHIPRDPRTHRRHEIEDTVEDQRLSAPPAGGREAAAQRAEHRSPQCGTERPAVHGTAQRPDVLNLLLRTGDHHRVESEQKPRQRRGHRPEKKPSFTHLPSSMSDIEVIADMITHGREKDKSPAGDFTAILKPS